MGFVFLALAVSLASLPPAGAPSDVLVVVNKDASTVSVIAIESGTALATLASGGTDHRPR